MTTILVLQPIRPSNPPALRERADALISAMLAANPGMSFDVAQDDAVVPAPPALHPSIYLRHAVVRNYMLERYLRPHHTHVLWIDSDLVDYPAELPALLMAHQPSIVAPFAVLDKWPNRFYDIGGFIENGSRANMWAPFFAQEGEVIELDSVGCCYLAPAALYHAGVRYRPPPTDYYVEHWSVMQQAKKRGYRVCALRDVRVVHAWLPDYGLEAN